VLVAQGVRVRRRTSWKERRRRKIVFPNQKGIFSNANEADETRTPRPYGQGLRFRS
jgi:hypothetical protein